MIRRKTSVSSGEEEMARKARQGGGAVARRLTVAIEVMVIGAVLAIVPLLLRRPASGSGLHLASLTGLGLLIFIAGATMYFISDRRTYRRMLWWLLPMLKPPQRDWWEPPEPAQRRRAGDPQPPQAFARVEQELVARLVAGRPEPLSLRPRAPPRGRADSVHCGRSQLPGGTSCPSPGCPRRRFSSPPRP
jgi:hypothetical protein